MSIQEIVEIELDALCKTVCEYSTDNYIRSYAEKLCSLNYPKDVEKFKILVNKLVDWYDAEITTIENEQYIHSKESHFKSYSLLKEMKTILNC